MSDFDDAGFFFECWTSAEDRRRRNSKKVKKRKKNVPTEKEEKKKKKKKNSKFKEAMETRKEKKKKKKKKKENPEIGLTQADPKPRPNQTAKPELLFRDGAEETGRKKRVAFDLSPGCARIKRPKFASLWPKLKEEEEEAAGNSGGDDVNSQDLFITQKTFRASPSQTSSCDADAGGVEEPAPFHRDAEKKKETRFRRTYGKPEEMKREPETEEEEDERSEKANPFLNEPIVVQSSPDVSEGNRRSWTDAATQTENFFSSSFLPYQVSIATASSSSASSSEEELKPLDLSLPRRARNVAPAPEMVKEEEERPKAAFHPGGRRRRRRSDGTTKEEASPESEPEPKSADTTASSEDNEGQQGRGGGGGGRLDRTQVQMRLNESFFFKTKGDGRSPRAESPLMKLARGRSLARRTTR